MSRVEKTKELISRLHSPGINTEFSVLLDVKKLLENIALNLSELNDRLEKRGDGHISNE